MQYAILAVMSAVTGMTMRRIVFWRRCGQMRRARRLYLRASWMLGGVVWLSMAVQELILLACGQLSLKTGLPLHLCSLMGVLSLPMLLGGSRFLWHLSLYLGMPGALGAILFPAVLQTPWPQLTEVSFHAMHCAVFLASALPFALGRRPAPLGAAASWAFLMVFACVALTVNDLTGGNYLFLELPAAGTPLAALARGGVTAYRLSLAGLAALLLAVEGALVAVAEKRK